MRRTSRKTVSGRYLQRKNTSVIFEFNTFPLKNEECYNNVDKLKISEPLRNLTPSVYLVNRGFVTSGRFKSKLHNCHCVCQTPRYG